MLPKYSSGKQKIDLISVKSVSPIELDQVSWPAQGCCNLMQLDLDLSKSFYSVLLQVNAYLMSYKY